MSKQKAKNNLDIETLKQSLQREFVGRCKKNSAYSMRAFAKFLDIDQSFLSKFMRGQKSISTETALALSRKLGLKPSSLNNEKNVTVKDTFLPLLDDEFAVISDWYHFAILELSKTRKFKSDAKVIAQRLGIHVEEARSAIDRLRRIGLIRLEDGNFTLNAPNNTWTNSQATSDARKLLQKRLLDRGITAIETVPFELRENGSLTVAIEKKRLPEFKQKLAKIRLELGDFFQASSNLDEVYQLTISFFPLTKIEGDSNEDYN